jgi:hypothetical protein
MAECARFAVDRNVRLGQVYSDTFSLDQAADAYRQVEARQMGKGVFLFEPHG